MTLPSPLVLPPTSLLRHNSFLGGGQKEKDLKKGSFFSNTLQSLAAAAITGLARHTGGSGLLCTGRSRTQLIYCLYRCSEVVIAVGR